MQKSIVFMVLVCSVVLFSGCANYKEPQQHIFDKSMTFNIGFDSVWTKIIKWFTDNNTPIKNIEKVSGLITTEYNLNANSSKDCADCGIEGTLQSITDRVGNFSIIVERINDNQTKVSIAIYYKAILVTPNYSSNYAPPNRTPITCESTGTLEKKIFNYIGS